ncbi:MAG: 50S ribosomal protein L9 [Phycisphaerae bacterium]
MPKPKKKVKRKTPKDPKFVTMSSGNRKLMLKESIRNVGRVGDVVEVSSGFARNYLVPQGLALEPTPGNIAAIEERKKEVERLEKQQREEQKKLLEKVAGHEIAIERRANPQGHLFGSVTATDIAHALQAEGFEIDADAINLHGKIDRIDKFTVEIAFSEDLKAEIKVYVAPDPESKEAIDQFQKDIAERVAAEEAAREEAAKAEAAAAK